MITVDLAIALESAGVRWRPVSGDRFVIVAPELGAEVFTISDMVVEPRRHATGVVLHFNGTTEWALDTVTQDQTVWLPREDQLRDLLGGTFRRLLRTDSGYVVVVRGPGGIEHEHAATDAAEAYGNALLELVKSAGITEVTGLH